MSVLIGGLCAEGPVTIDDDQPLTFLASIAPLQSAITIASDGGARVKIDLPESEMPAIVRLMLYRGKRLRITLEIDDDGPTKNRDRYFEG